MEKSNKTFCKTGYYTKYSIDNNEKILVFVAKTNYDNFFKTLQIIRSFYSNCNEYQVATSEEVKNNKFTNICYSYMNKWGDHIQDKQIIVNFDFDNNKIKIGNKIYKVENSNEYTYKILKTKIKAMDGIEGFYNFIVKNMHIDSTFHNRTHGILERMLNS